jgi:predicted amidohydrolase
MGAESAESSEAKVRRLRNALKPRATNPFSRIVESIGRVMFINPPDDPMRVRRGPGVRIVLVSMPSFDYVITQFSSLRNEAKVPDGVDPDVFLRQLVQFDKRTTVEMLSVFTNALNTAIDQYRPDVICFNELGLPTSDMTPSFEAKRLAWEASQKHEVLIVAGTGHDWHSLHNTGYVFRPGGPKTGDSFHKSISAQSVGELINTPPARKVVAVEYRGLKIAIMICLDVADYASIAAVVKVGDGVDVLLVPCYTQKFEAMGAIADITSKALPGVVAMVNAELPDSDARCCRISAFGNRQKPTDSKDIQGGAKISVVEIEHAQFQADRTRLQVPTDDIQDVEYLFGRRGLPVLHSPEP